jgi:hypothetical protein
LWLPLTIGKTATACFSYLLISTDGFVVHRYIIAAVVAVPAIYLLATSGRPVANTNETPGPKQSDPAKRAREKKENTPNSSQVIEHQEDREPEKFKVAFGQLHSQKRVDGAPDERNHQALSDKNRQRSE